MLQGKTHLVTFAPGAQPWEKLLDLERALIDQGVYSAHQIALQAPGYPDLPAGRWPSLYCTNEDLNLAKTAEITW